MKMTDMKVTKKEAKEMKAEQVSMDVPEYPWGLSIRLDEESIAKLGMSKLPDVGTNLTLTANVEVTEVSERDSMGGKKHRNISLQITAMSLEGQKTTADVAEKMYG